MAIMTYSADFREKDGLVIDSDDFMDNVHDIEDAANSIGWQGIESRSLDNFHLKRGEATKSVEGLYQGLRNFSAGSYVDLCSLSYAVSPGCAVYLVAEVSWDSKVVLDNAGLDAEHSPSNISLNSVDATGGAIGSWVHTNASNPDVHGSAGIVWAYRPSGAATELFNTTTLRMRLEVGSISPSNRHARGNLTAFVIHR